MNTRRTTLSVLAGSTLVVALFVGAYQGAYANRTGTDGCTPGYWKNHIEVWEDGIYIQVLNDAGIQTSKTLFPDSLVKDVFDVEFVGDYADYNTLTLEEALNLNGGPGGVNQLLRHGVAALLNAGFWDPGLTMPTVDFSLDDGQVYTRVRAGLDGNDPAVIVDLAKYDNVADTLKKKNELEAANESVCPLDNTRPEV